MVLYHGTDEESARKILTNGIDLYAGNTCTDFGQGFYLTPDIVMATQWAQRKGLFTRGAIVSYKFEEEKASMSSKCKHASTLELSHNLKGETFWKS